MKMEFDGLSEIDCFYICCVDEFNDAEIMIWADDGITEPHFHIIEGNPYHPRMDVCLSMSEPKYIHHEGGRNDRLSEIQLKQLFDHLNSPHRHLPKVSVWTFLLCTWKLNNENAGKIDMAATIPDYTQLADNESSQKQCVDML